MLEVAGGILIAVCILLAAVILLPVVFALIGRLISGVVNGAAAIFILFVAGVAVFATLAIIGIAIEYLLPGHGTNGALALFAVGGVGYMVWDTAQYRRWKAQNRDLFPRC